MKMCVNWKKSRSIIGDKIWLHVLVTFVFFIVPGSAVIVDCDKMYVHNSDGGPLNGTFSSLGYGVTNYPPDLQCIYTFIAEPNHRVKLIFDDFVLRGTPATCDIDYVDIYAEMPDVHVDIMDQQLSGRYCGSVSPRIRISMHNVIVLIFHSRADSKGAKGFSGSYYFIPGKEYMFGTPAPHGICGFTIDQAYKKNGSIVSPTYPGAYPRNLHCFYRLKGAPGQRIKLFFWDLELYFGGQHCPYDSLTIYDGDSNSAPIIRKICGLQQNVTIYSKKEELYMEFVSRNPPQAEHRGFHVDYLFSSKFVDVEKMIGQQSYVAHMRGSECDIRVKSSKESTHIIQSPNYPHQYPVNTTCTYILDGLQGDQDLEKVVLTFQSFFVASKHPDCEDTYVAIFLAEQEWKTEEPDVKNCTSGHVPKKLISEGPRMVLVFHSGSNLRDQGFKATVKFITDFGIPGEPIDDGVSSKCQFMFNSTRSLQGSFNSPRYPANYPLETDCYYYLNGRSNGIGERVKIYFEQFALHRGLSASNQCGDWLEIGDIFPEGKYQMIAKYCADKFPGPIISSHGSSRIRVQFHSDDGGAATGFKADYEFDNHPVFQIPKNPKGGCGGKIVGKKGGWFTSPNFPIRYSGDLICVWMIEVRRGYRVLLKAITMKVEGEMADTSVSCQQAVIRIFTNVNETFNHEFCGTEISQVPALLSNENMLKINFITSSQVNGLAGFNFSWTEVQIKKQGTPCNTMGEFRCMNNKDLCIDEVLRCDGIPNCGDGDNSDEANCEGKEAGDKWTSVIVGSTASGLILLIVLIIICIVFQRKTKNKKKHSRSRRSKHRHKQHESLAHSSNFARTPLNFDNNEEERNSAVVFR